MEKIKKIRFSDIVGMLEKDEMKEILGGSNGVWYTCGAGVYKNGMLSPDLSTSSISSNGFGGGKAIGSTFGGIPYNPGTNNDGSSFGGSSGSGSSYSSSTYGSNSYNIGWSDNDRGITTNDPFAINRFFNFLASNNGTLSNSQFGRFIDSEAVYVPKDAVPLNNVTVPNTYKGPSNIPQGVIYNNGILEISNSYYDGGSTSGGGSFPNINPPRTSAVLSPFTKDQIINSFKKIDFAGMALKSIPDWDPIKKEYNYTNSFQPIMKINVDGAISIALYEELSLSVYDNDGSVNGTATIGFGHKLHDNLITSADPKTITFDQAISYFASDIIKTENMLNRKIENLDLTGKISRNQYFALFDMAYNGGGGSDSIVTSVLNSMKSGGVTAANKTIEDAYYNADPTKGIMDRRYFEAQAFINGRTLTPEESRAELINLGLKKIKE